MKKSNVIKLVLVSATLAACNHKNPHEQKVFMRADSTAGYTQTHGNGSHFWGYYVFRPYGIYNSFFGYTRAGYYSGGIHESSNIGHNSFKTTTVRGGFGKSSFHVSS